MPAIPVITMVGVGIGIAGQRGQARKQDAAQDQADKVEAERLGLKTEMFEENKPIAEQDLNESLAQRGLSNSTTSKYLKELQQKAFARKETSFGLDYSAIDAQSAMNEANRPDWVTQFATNTGQAGMNYLSNYYTTPVKTTPYTNPYYNGSSGGSSVAPSYSYGNNYQDYTIPITPN